jgi:hypothetical protein
MDAIKTITGRVPGVVVEIYYDTDPESPAEWENLGEITYNKSARTRLGYVGKTADEDAEIARKVRDGEYIGIPVWAYVHSGATVQAAWSNPFGCPWDSGRSGWVYVPKAKVLEEFSRKRMSPELLAKVHEILRAEVKVFDQYLRGDVYGFRVLDKRSDPEGMEVDACWGFYGLDYVVGEAESALEYATKDEPVQLELEM